MARDIISRPAESLAPVTVEITATVPLDTQPVLFAAVPETENPTDATVYEAGQWVGDVGMTRTGTINVGPGGALDPGPGTWEIYAKVADPPILPIVRAGKLRLY